MQFFSQVGQDRYLFENFFYGKRNGVFVDIGAYDGEKFSNSLFFERYMGWRGLCVEPLPSAFAKLAASRKAICRQVCVADFEGESEFLEADAGIDEKVLSGLPKYFDPRHVERLKRAATATATRKVEVKRLTSLLLEHDLLAVDYCSIDTEGSELSILSDLVSDPDFGKFSISVLTVENTYDDPRIVQLMSRKGYDLVGKLEQDYIFKRRDVQRLPRTTVICAVWHGDPQRLELLRGHVENLSRQTVPIEIVYVFDGGDEVPDWLAAKAVSVKQPLSIYQAWNVALSLVATPLVMNLNLDDRLNPDAIETMERALARHQADAVAGDWKVCFSQDETDQTEPCYPADRLPFVPDWPPRASTVTRLGSGTGQRGTFGPAVLWSVELHIGAPRYPWRFLDGTVIKWIGDLVWWSALQSMGKKILRVPMVVGNYHSHPSEQAEFRKLLVDEEAMVKSIGCALL